MRLLGECPCPVGFPNTLRDRTGTFAERTIFLPMLISPPFGKQAIHLARNLRGIGAPTFPDCHPRCVRGSLMACHSDFTVTPYDWQLFATWMLSQSSRSCLPGGLGLSIPGCRNHSGLVLYHRQGFSIRSQPDGTSYRQSLRACRRKSLESSQGIPPRRSAYRLATKTCNRLSVRWQDRLHGVAYRLATKP